MEMRPELATEVVQFDTKKRAFTEKLRNAYDNNHSVFYFPFFRTTFKSLTRKAGNGAESSKLWNWRFLDFTRTFEKWNVTFLSEGKDSLRKKAQVDVLWLHARLRGACW